MKRLVTCCIILFLLFCLFLPSRESLAKPDIESTLDNYVETFLGTHRIPGAAIAIVQDRETIYAKSWGVTGGSEEAVTLETPFLIGSVTKSLTALAIVKLLEENKIMLDDPVQAHLPWFTLQDQGAAAQITIRHLLAHTSGLSTYTGLAIADQGSADENAIVSHVRNLATEELTAAPGEQHQYSNANYLILGALVEEVSGQPFSEYMKQYIFSPLGMEHAAADHGTAARNGYLGSYQSWFGFPTKSRISYDNGGTPYGYIVASAEDIASYIKFLQGNEPNDFLTEESLSIYLSPLVQQRENRYYGFGLRLTTFDSGETMIWHSGATPDSRAELFILPEHKWGGVILTNKNHRLEEEAVTHLREGIIQILHDEQPLHVPKKLPTIQWIMSGLLSMLLIRFISLLKTMKSNSTHKNIRWRIWGLTSILSAILLIPLLTYSVHAPWHTITVFTPDIAWLTIFTVILLSLNGLTSIYVSLRKG
jgi:CubicO group peptidase (beta-lactamase class C family)